MALIQVQNLSKYFGERTLFQDVTFEVFENDHIGLIGRNGCGKSTLFSLLLGIQEADAGQISKSRDCKIGTLEQSLPKDVHASLYDITLKVFDHLMKIEQDLMQIAEQIHSGDGDIDRLIQKQYRLQERFEQEGGLTYRSRTRATLLGLGFSAEELDKKVINLSGGETRKALLARLLLSDANLLLLDEPTNHLDLQAIEWLEDFLLNFRGAYIVVSHDRYFLDRVTSKTFELIHERLQVSNGNYTRHQQLSFDAHQTAERQYQKTLREIKRIEGIIVQQRRWNQARNYVTIASKEKQIERLKKDLVKPEAPPAHIRFHFEAPEPTGNEVLYAQALEKSFGSQCLFRDLSFLVRKGEHVCLLGANGRGKTTLLKILLGQEEPDKGSYRIGANVKLGYFEQSMRKLNGDKTIYDEISDTYPRMDSQQIRNALGTFLFRGDDVFKQVGALSGGELARIQLLKLMLEQNNVLLLDEPTNHLDIPSREQLENALCDYEGTLFVVTHDRYFINRIADRILVLTENGISEFSGDWDEYLHSLAQAQAPTENTIAEEPTQQQNAYVLARERRSAQNKAKGELKRIESAVEEKENKISALEELLVKPEISGDYLKASEIADELAAERELLEKLYEDWEASEAYLESLMEETDGL